MDQREACGWDSVGGSALWTSFLLVDHFVGLGHCCWWNGKSAHFLRSLSLENWLHAACAWSNMHRRSAVDWGSQVVCLWVREMGRPTDLTTLAELHYRLDETHTLAWKAVSSWSREAPWNGMFWSRFFCVPCLATAPTREVIDKNMDFHKRGELKMIPIKRYQEIIDAIWRVLSQNIILHWYRFTLLK